MKIPKHHDALCGTFIFYKNIIFNNNYLIEKIYLQEI